MELPKDIQMIMNTLEQASFQVYVVGGAVRDLLMGRPTTDWDLTTDATPEQILELFPDGYSNNQFGTVGIPHLDGVVEITTMRREGEYKDSRRPDSVEWTSKIEEDLARRDFTMNAIAMGSKGELIDPFEGQLDIEKKLIKAVGDPHKRFQEDALRLMRAVRLAAQLGFTIDPPTWEAVKTQKDLIKNISWERIRDELLRLVVSDAAEHGIKQLQESGLLDIILPEMTPAFGLQQGGEKHDRQYDVGEHLIAAMKFTPTTDPIIKLAALLHDIGKPPTHKVKNGSDTFYGHEIVGAKMVAVIAQRLRLSRKDSERLETLVRYHMFSVGEKQTDSALRRFVKNVGLQNLEDMMALREGDRLGGGTASATSWRLEQFKERIQKLLVKPFTVKDLEINGEDVMKELNIPAGRKVGEILDALFKEVEKDASKNKKDYLLKRLNEIGS